MTPDRVIQSSYSVSQCIVIEVQQFFNFVMFYKKDSTVNVIQKLSYL